MIHARTPRRTHRKTHRRRAFAMRDLIACLFMFVIALAVLLPGCGEKAEDPPPANEPKGPGLYKLLSQRAALVGTNNNLRQLGIAAHNSDSATKKLPPAFGAFLRAPGASIHVHLLPFDEQNPLYESYLNGGGNAVVDTAIVPQYLAAMDPTATGGGVGVTNFAANVRVFSDTARSVAVTEPISPLAQDTMSFGVGNGFPDGTSNTLMFATRYSEGGTGTTTYVRTLITADPTSPSGAFFGAHAPSSTAKANCLKGNDCTYQHMPSKQEAMMTPSAYGHSYWYGGLAVCMGDCVVRYVNPKISVATWNAIVGPDDRLIINDGEW